MPAKTIRCYEEIGLLPGPASAENNYRRYTEPDIERLRLIAGARQLDPSSNDWRPGSWEISDSCCERGCLRPALSAAGLMDHTLRSEADLAVIDCDFLDTELVGIQEAETKAYGVHLQS